MVEKCLVCDQEVVSDLSKVREKGIIGLVKASVLRKDGKDQDLKKKKSGVVHGACRRDYTRTDSIKRYVSENTADVPSTSCPSQTLRSSQSTFDFRSKCFLCSEICDEQREKKNTVRERRTIFTVRTTTFHASIIARGQERGDDWGADVVRRVCAVADLHAADAMYHGDCYRRFMLKSSSSDRGRGRPSDDGISQAMEEVFSYIEENDSCQFSIDELLEQVTGEPPHVKTVINRLKAKYGDRIVIGTLQGKKTIICLRSAGNKILNDAWYTARCKDEQSERERIVRKAGEIILQDIETMAYNNSEYPPPDNFCSGAEDMVPQSLRAFMEYLSKNKRSRESVGRKLTVIAHALIAVVRPRSFPSPILNSIALFISRKFGSKSLVYLLSKLGLSASYHSAQQLELSTIHLPKQPLPKGTFCQYVFDNADYNVATIDGCNTFHSMGGIKCVTPASALPPSSNVPRLKSAPTQEDLGNLGVLELQPFEATATNALQHVSVKDLSTLNPTPPKMLSPSIPDLLWMCGKWLQDVHPIPEVPNIPEWKGFMQLVSKPINAETTAVTFLPFINSPPTEYNTVHTALQYAHQHSQELGANICFVTFDQPLYLKAREIQFGTITVRLGGFHTLMSFMGCIGHTMAGSGLKEVLCQVFAANSVEKMLSGHAYSRAVRGHFLVQAVLAHIILEGANISTAEKKGIASILSKIDDMTPEKLEEPCLLSTLNKLESRLESLKSNGPTAALWVQYFQMVTLMKKFIDSERRGDWFGHLACVQQMIPFFHASGHFHYAKCAHIYVQDMIQLKDDHPETFKQFAEEGYFTINRSGKPWAGVWSDMVIEQTLMRSMKSSGGLTRGRGISDSVLAKWICGSPGSSAICSSLEEFAGVVFASGEQHVDFRASRQKRDAQDRAKMKKWFNDHPPFPQMNSLMSLSTGLIGNEKINCHQALDIGTATMQSFVGCKFGEMKQSRKNIVLSLASMSCSITIGGEKATINPLTIFQRTLIAKKSDADVEKLLEYELSPFPLSLFNEGGMRKGTKSTLYSVLPEEENPALNVLQTTNVVDGGFLLHRVKWKPRSTISSICDQCINYVLKHYGKNCTVVFDGYGDLNNTKRAEQKRRGLLKTSVDINFQDLTIITIQQEHFLGNERNKTRLIDFLKHKMSLAQIDTLIASGDADTVIVRCGLEKAAVHPSVAVIGEDVDLVVLLVALTPRNHSGDIFFLKPGRGKVSTKVYSIHRLQQLPFANNILLLHSFSGCDTTSAIYGKSKVTMDKTFTTNPGIITEVAAPFNHPSSTPEEIGKAGEKLFLTIFQEPRHHTTLDKLRYHAFLKASAKPNADLKTLPPTRGSALQHSLRTYLQVQQWLGNSLPPTNWGWAMGDDRVLRPVTTLAPMAPEEVLNTILCRCTTGCSIRCGCRKAGIPCSVACIGCHGSCTNGAPMEDITMSDEEEDLDL